MFSICSGLLARVKPLIPDGLRARWAKSKAAAQTDAPNGPPLFGEPS
jgi:hypothetical protein